MGRKQQAEALEEKVKQRKETLAKHLAAGKDKAGDVVKRDRKLLKRAARHRRKLLTGGIKPKED